MKQLSILSCVLLVSTCVVEGSDEIPGAAQKQPIVLTGGTVHCVSGPPITNGSVVFRKGRIVAVGPAEEVGIPEDAQHIDCRNRHIYPGLFEAHSQIGLVEIRAVRATRDMQESGSINPNVRAHVSVNPDSEIVPVTRSNGVLLALTAPTGGRISGQAAVLQLDGWTYEDMTLKAGAAMKMSWPRVPRQIEKSDSSRNPVDEIRDLFDSARAYARSKKVRPEEHRTDLKLEALQPVLNRRMPLLVAANSLAVIQSAVAFAAEQKVRLIIIGGYDAPLCADLLRQHKVPVIVSAVYRLPRRRSDSFDDAYTLPERLRQAGIQFCISGSASSRVSNTRNLPYHAGTAVAYGLPEDDALKAITLWPAEILGGADRVGSIEPGKDATLFVSTGTPLETTSRVTKAWIQGREVDLFNRHRRLYEKYREKYRQQNRR